ncbi:FtsW/RodA/SpoVE family cell cycle protein [Helicobacter marmotae]|uniref:Cell wall polymerase n=1 Tax=Helicobacter marmotae TaxID=152490 RepID=A0A3D8I7Q1_9HELI|nr:FtsW/RodA/SpoVE family cell cycle protein [Helicobacter marmotae]RDU61179.1 rod shape-determining protein RodA [Helicobacter marmotae]
MIDRRILSHFDYILVLLVLPLVGLSLFLVYELDPVLFSKQVKYMALGCGLMVFLFFVPFRNLRGVIIGIYMACLVLLILVHFIGTQKLGAQRWVDIPFTHFSIQPSEIMKIALMLLLASYITLNPPPKGGYGIKEFCIISSFILVPFLIILKEPDLGTAMIILLTGFGTLFLVGVNKKIWITLGLLIAFLAPVAYVVDPLKDYQKRRIMDFVSDKSPYQVNQALIAIGASGAFGKSKEESTQSQLKFLPYANTDFIFAYFMERFGMFGAIGLLILFFLIIVHILSLGFAYGQDYFLQVITSYIAILIFLYVGINVCMVIGLAPVVGVPLPLMSYGGTSFVTFLTLFTILENVLAFRFVFEYNAGTKPGPLAQLVRALGS